MTARKYGITDEQIQQAAGDLATKYQGKLLEGVLFALGRHPSQALFRNQMQAYGPPVTPGEHGQMLRDYQAR